MARRGIAALLLVALATTACDFGYPGVAIRVRNDTGTPRVVRINDEFTEETITALVPPGFVGVAYSAGTSVEGWNGTVEVLSVECAVLAVIDDPRVNVHDVIVITETGATLAPLEDAYPPLTNAQERHVEVPGGCGGDPPYIEPPLPSPYAPS